MKNKFTEEQIIRMLKAHEGGGSARGLCREAGISEPTFYRWKSRFSGMEVNKTKRLRELEAENQKLKEFVANLSSDNKILKEIVSKT